MHKQLFQLNDQVTFIRSELNAVVELEAKAPKAEPTAPFPVVKSATVVDLGLGLARQMLEKAAAMLQAEINFYEESDRKLEELKAADTPDTAAIEKVEKETSAHEAVTIGTGIVAIELANSVQGFLFKTREHHKPFRK